MNAKDDFPTQLIFKHAYYIFMAILKLVFTKQFEESCSFLNLIEKVKIYLKNVITISNLGYKYKCKLEENMC